MNILSLDIETGYATNDAIKERQEEIALRDVRRKPLNKRLKDEKKIADDLIDKEQQYIQEVVTAEREYREALEAVKSKSSLSNAAVIVCIGIFYKGLLINLSICDNISNDEKLSLLDEGIIAITFSSEESMMKSFSELMDTIFSLSTEPLVISGFNTRSFDFPKLRLACKRNGVKIPIILQSNNEMRQFQHDVMLRFVYAYNVENRHKKMISLEKVCQELNIPFQKSDTFNGKDVPGAYERGEHLKIIRYNMPDVIASHIAEIKLQ